MKTIRKAQIKDIPQLLDLLTQVNQVHAKGRPDLFQEHTKYDADQLEEMLQDPQTIILVHTDENDTCVGYAFGQYQYPQPPLMQPIKTLYIDDICIDKDHRRQHIGTNLLEAMKKIAKENGCYNITLNVWNLNPGAYTFYANNGMNILKTTMEMILTKENENER